MGRRERRCTVQTSDAPQEVSMVGLVVMVEEMMAVGRAKEVGMMVAGVAMAKAVAAMAKAVVVTAAEAVAMEVVARVMAVVARVMAVVARAVAVMVASEVTAAAVTEVGTKVVMLEAVVKVVGVLEAVAWAAAMVVADWGAVGWSSTGSSQTYPGSRIQKGRYQWRR